MFLRAKTGRPPKDNRVMFNICNSNILADRDYGTKDICNYIDSQRANYTIPLKTNVKEPWKGDTS